MKDDPRDQWLTKFAEVLGGQLKRLEPSPFKQTKPVSNGQVTSAVWEAVQSASGNMFSNFLEKQKSGEFRPPPPRESLDYLDEILGMSSLPWIVFLSPPAFLVASATTVGISGAASLVWRPTKPTGVELPFKIGDTFETDVLGLPAEVKIQFKPKLFFNSLEQAAGFIVPVGVGGKLGITRTSTKNGMTYKFDLNWDPSYVYDRHGKFQPGGFDLKFGVDF